MKTQFFSVISLALASAGAAFGQAGADYTNIIRQVQLPTNVKWDVTVLSAGETLSPLAIDPGGARFELWTVRSEPLTTYLLDTKYVGTYVPMAEVIIYTEDPNTYTAIPRTRADRPFAVQVTTSGLRSEVTAPEPSKSVKLLRHVQSYGIGGVGENIDRTQATLIHQVSLVNNAIHRLSYSLSSVPAADFTKKRGEERFSVFSLEDYQAPSSQLASVFVQIWPMADGSISGITQNQVFRTKLPTITLTLNDLYPDSRTYAQVYQGDSRDGVEGIVVPGSALVVYDSIPKNDVLTIPGSAWDAAVDKNGRWTLELLTVTPFDIVPLARVTFEMDRTIKMNGSFTTIE